MKKLRTNRKPVNDSRGRVVGMACNPNTNDERESPSYTLVNLLKERVTETAYYDPSVPVIHPKRGRAYWPATHSVNWVRPPPAGFDAVSIAPDHPTVKHQEMADESRCLDATRSAMAA